LTYMYVQGNIHNSIRSNSNFMMSHYFASSLSIWVVKPYTFSVRRQRTME